MKIGDTIYTKKGLKCVLTEDFKPRDEDILASVDGIKYSIDIEHLDLCNNEADCDGAGGYWHDDKCNIEEQVAVVGCSADYLDLCNETECGSLGIDYSWDLAVGSCVASTTL